MGIKRSKFGNKKLTNEYGTFDSKKEFARYLQLLEMEKQGLVSDLQRQFPIEIIPPLYESVEVILKTKTKIQSKFIQHGITYNADFCYYQNGERIIEDVKASYDFKDPVYKLKKKLIRYLKGISIKETY